MSEKTQRFYIQERPGTTKVEQVAAAIRREIDRGTLERNESLPSINVFSKEYSVARDTIEKAYKLLSKQGNVFAIPGKGYFVAERTTGKIRVLLIFNKLSSYKKIIYDSFLDTLGKKAIVELQIHHYDLGLLREILQKSAGKYDYYVVMPHFKLRTSIKDINKVLNEVDPSELVLLDKRVTGINPAVLQVYQDFQQDIYKALVSALDLLKKYHTVHLILAADSLHPREIVEGTRQFCTENGLGMELVTRADGTSLIPGTVYIATNETDLGIIVKQSRLQQIVPGKDIGIISFNETVFKELLDITVITTDFEAMGRTVAQSILKGKTDPVHNAFYMIRRGSL